MEIFAIILVLVFVFLIFLMIFSVYFALKRIVKIAQNDYLVSGSIIAILFLILLSILVPIHLYDNSDAKLSLDSAEKISNIMIPFVTLAGIIMAFLAFNEQKEANKLNSSQFNLSQIEKSFYEMLNNHIIRVGNYKLIKENDKSQELNGAIIFESIYVFFKKELDSYRKNEISKERYINCNDINKNFKIIDENIYKTLYGFFLLGHGNGRLNQYNDYEFSKESKGYKSILSNYFRSLFSIIEYVDKKQIEDTQKKLYISSVCSQLTVHEQLLIFYNYLYYNNSFNEKHLITKYRLIKDIDRDDIFEYEYFYTKINELISYYNNTYINEKKPLFNFQKNKESLISLSNEVMYFS